MASGRYLAAVFSGLSTRPRPRKVRAKACPKAFVQPDGHYLTTFLTSTSYNSVELEGKMGKYGYFDDQKRGIVANPRTPLPWINYLGTQDFFRLISNTAGGYLHLFYKDAKLLRLTRYRYNNRPMDCGRHYFYIKEGEPCGIPAGPCSDRTG